MIDNDIIKAFEILDKFDFFQGQRAGRELWSEKPFDVQEEDVKSFSADVKFFKEFIKLQKAEIERLQTENLILKQKRVSLFEHLEIIETTRAKTIKEFAERLKEHFDDWSDKGESNTIHIRSLIDGLVKEMLEERSNV